MIVIEKIPVLRCVAYDSAVFRATNRRNHPTLSCGTTRFVGCAAGLRAENIARPARVHEAGNPAKFVEVLGFAFPRRTNPLHGHVRCSQDAAVFRATNRRNHPTLSCGTTRFVGCAAGLRAEDNRPASART